jgi:L-lysine cyclodeaminase
MWETISLNTILLTIADIRHVIREVGLDSLMRQMIDALEAAFREYSPATVVTPTRAGFHYEQPYPGLLEWMPSLTQGETATIKVVGYHPHNPTHHEIPTILSSIGVYDVRTGLLSGLLDGTFLTALRTGAASAIASRCFALPDSRTVGVIGLGAQAVTQLHALATVFPIERVLASDIDRDASGSFARRTAFLDLPVEIVSPERAAAEADILCTTTSVPVGCGPVFEDVETKPWLHINAVGSDFPGKTEVPYSLLTRAYVCPDFHEQARLEGESQRLTTNQIGVALYEVVQNPDSFTKYQRSLTIFDSTGWAIEDAVAAQLMLDHAQRLGVGSAISLQHLPTDPLNPYEF